MVKKKAAITKKKSIPLKKKAPSKKKSTKVSRIEKTKPEVMDVSVEDETQTGDLPVSDVKHAFESEVDRVFFLQKANRWKMANTSYIERIERLKKIQDAIESNMPLIQDAIYRDFKKSPHEVDITEIFPVLLEITDAIKNLKKWTRPQTVSTPITLFPSKSELIYEPKGLVLIIGPWNYPFHLIAAPLVAAIAAGNCVIIRPSDDTYHTSIIVKKLFGDIFPEDEVAIFNGGIDLSNYLLTKPFDHIFFTGSPKVGGIVMEAAAKNLTSVTLELGGKSPVILDETAVLDYSTLHIIWGKILNGGQTCVGVDYVMVHESKFNEFIEKARAVLENFYGDPTSWKSNPDFCRIINGKNFNRLKSMLEEAISSGSKVEVGGVLDENEKYISPTILSNVSLNLDIMQEEIFGPILPVLTYSSIDEAIRIIQSKWKPLSLYVFSKNDYNIKRITNNTSSGALLVNGVIVHLTNPNLPFGGVNHSGHGSYHGFFGFKTFSHERAVLRVSRLNLLWKLFPPYNDGTSKFLKFIKFITKLF